MTPAQHLTFADRISAPAIEIRIEVEGAPRVRFDCLSSSEEDRVRHWITSNAALLELVGMAIDLRDAAEAMYGDEWA